MSVGLTMCELSVDDEERRSEQNEGGGNRCYNWNDLAENWVQNKMMNDHKIENWVEMTDGHKSWNKSLDNLFQTIRFRSSTRRLASLLCGTRVDVSFGSKCERSWFNQMV